MGALTSQKEGKRALRLTPEIDLIGGFDDEEIDLKQYWHLLRKYLWTILGISLLVALLVALFVSSLRPVYRSTATMLVEGQGNKGLSLEEIYRADAYQNEYFQTQVEILKSRDLAHKVIARLKLGEKPEFLGYPEEKKKPLLPWREWLAWMPALISLKSTDEAKNSLVPDPEEKIIADFKKRLTAVPRRNTELVDISFESNDPRLAKDIVNVLGEVFIESNIETRVSVTRKGSEWLGERLQALREKLSASEKQLQDYLEKEHLVDLEGVMTLTSKEVDSNSQRLAEARSKRAAEENLYSKIRSLGDNIYKNVEAVPEIYQDASVQSLKEKEAEIQGKISDLGQRYGPDHPSMVSARSELESVNALLRRQISTIVSGIKNRYDVAKADEQAALNSLETNKSQVQVIGRKQGMVRELQQQVDSNKKLYETFFDRFKETSEGADLKAPNIRFIDRGNLSVEPVKPKKTMIVGLSFGGTAFICILLALLLERVDSTLKTPEDVETRIGAGVAVLGVIPLFKQSKRKVDNLEVGRIILAQPKSGFSEAVRTVRTSMVLSALDNQHNAWLITSSVPGEGKTTLAMNIGFAMAQMETGGVILLEGDLRRATLAKRLDLPSRAMGLSHFLAHEAELDACIHTIHDSKLKIMPAGLIPPNPSELLSSHRFTLLLDALQARFSIILIDSPPVHNVSDAYLLAQYVQSVIYIVHADKTPVDIVKRGIKGLQHFGDKMPSIILNKIDFDKTHRYGGYYNNYYYQHYYAKNPYGDDDTPVESGKQA